LKELEIEEHQLLADIETVPEANVIQLPANDAGN
jgi:hypothetical protein